MKKFLIVMILGLVLCGCVNKDVNDVDNSGTNDNNVTTEEMTYDLYDKYVKYSDLDINGYGNINVNEDNSNEYMVKLAVYNIINDNKVNIKNYSWYNDGEFNEGWRNGYKITITQVENYINKLFNVNKVINYGELDLKFLGDISVHYYSNEDAYRLIADSSIPKSGADFDVYSKYISSETNGDNIILYSNYFVVVGDMGSLYIEDRVDDEKICTLCYSTYEGDYICPAGSNESYVQYVTNNLSQEIGKFKHTFTKKEDGNYYWVSTENVN